MKFSFWTTFRRAWEAIFVLGIVLFFFLLILLTINAVFPTGQNLLALIRTGSEDPFLAGHADKARDLHLSTDEGDFGLGDHGRFSAVLYRFEKQVKSKRAGQIAWRETSRGMTFYDGDAIQTFTRSSATLSVNRDNSLTLGENSLIVLREMERDLFTRENRAVVVLMAGDISGKVSGAAGEARELQILAPGVVASVAVGADRAGPARFRMKVNPDNSSVLTVLEGKADITVDGRTMEIGEAQTVRIQQGKEPVFLRPPPSAPVLVSPEEGGEFPFRDIPPAVTFAWDPVSASWDHHLVLARDAAFEDIVFERNIRGDRFVHPNLTSGEYYWRVSSVNLDGEGKFSAGRRFTVDQDLEPPALEVDYPDKGDDGDRFRLRGRTDPGARIFVGGIPVTIDQKGEFTYDLFLQRGFNVIVVEAVDRVGNVSYFSSVVNVQF